jgi:hypothetical protein
MSGAAAHPPVAAVVQKAWTLTDFGDLEHIVRKYMVTYEPTPGYIDRFFTEVSPVRLFAEGRTDPSRGAFAQRRCDPVLAARAFDYFYSRFEGTLGGGHVCG